MKCDLNCPPGLPFFCCNCCHAKPFVIEHCKKNGLEDKWTDDHGFWSLEGCVLDDRPQECQGYDCRLYRMFMSFDMTKEGWKLSSLLPVPIKNITKEFIDEYSALMEKYE